MYGVASSKGSAADHGAAYDFGCYDFVKAIICECCADSFVSYLLFQYMFLFTTCQSSYSARLPWRGPQSAAQLACPCKVMIHHFLWRSSLRV
jgi:hypothetical protein